MARYIEADALLENLKKQYGEELGWQCTVNMSDVGMMIEDAPTADVVEVVRCKECQFRGSDDCAMYYTCDCGHQYEWNGGNDYCSYGKKRS